MKIRTVLVLMGLGISSWSWDHSALMGSQVKQAKEDQNQAWHFPNPPSIKNISVGSRYADVIKAFGKPLHVNKKRADLEGKPDLQELHYPNLTFEMTSEGKSQSYVSSIVVTGSQWTMYPGLKVGMSREQVTRLLAEAPDTSDTTTPWFISLQSNKIAINFYVRVSKGKVKEIGIAEDWR